MEFINRREEMKRLERLTARRTAGLAVVWGRRRLGKSRLLTEWSRQHGGTYWVADESASAIQRKYLAAELESVLPGFSAVEYPDWTVFFDRLSKEAREAHWRGPLILDEFPYLVTSAPELPSVLQRWIDREKREDGLQVAISGSSQRMMQSSVLNSSAPLYGRADEILKLEPLLAGYAREAVDVRDPASLLDYYTCWGGVPHYWELSAPFGRRWEEAVDDLVLSPLGVLHEEVERLLRQEMPSAIPLRPILDAIGLGAHRSSEIAGRLQTSATSIAGPLRQLQDLGYVRREVPFGESEKRSKKSLYRLADPFLRLWFRVVAPHRGVLTGASKAVRRKLLHDVWPQLRAEAWEELCRQSVPRLAQKARNWMPAGRSWASGGGEWDVVSLSLDGEVLLLGECKSLAKRADPPAVSRIVDEVLAKVPPAPGRRKSKSTEYWIFLPALRGAMPSLPPNVRVINGDSVFNALRS